MLLISNSILFCHISTVQWSFEAIAVNVLRYGGGLNNSPIYKRGRCRIDLGNTGLRILQNTLSF